MAAEILHELERFLHFCFIRALYIISEHKSLVAILSKDEAMLSQWLQCIMLRMHPYRVHIICKPSPDLYIMDWLSYNNHTANKDQEITRMKINVSAINTLVNMSTCTSLEDIQVATWEGTHLQKLKSYIIQGLLHKKDKLEHSMIHYWAIRGEFSRVDGITMKDKRIIIPFLSAETDNAAATQ